MTYVSNFRLALAARGIKFEIIRVEPDRVEMVVWRRD